MVHAGCRGLEAICCYLRRPFSIQDSKTHVFIPLSDAVGRQFAWRCLTKCSILNLNIPVLDELLVLHLTDLFTLCGIGILQATIVF